jgi:hypothetical protein
MTDDHQGKHAFKRAPRVRLLLVTGVLAVVVIAVIVFFLV